MYLNVYMNLWEGLGLTSGLIMKVDLGDVDVCGMALQGLFAATQVSVYDLRSLSLSFI